MNRKAADAIRITSAGRGRSADIRSREIRYLASMGVRTACFFLAFFTSGVLRWVFFVAAFVLPYIAVVAANAGGRRDAGGPQPFDQPQLRALEGRKAGEPAPLDPRR